MAIVETGNELSTLILQPGWSVQSDGFGLNTGSCTFVCDQLHGFSLNVRGTAHPNPSYSYMKAHKASVVFETLQRKTIKVDYVGIDPSVNSGVRTNANCSNANGLTSESLTSHPNFFTVQAGYLGPIAGASPYTQDSPNNYAPNVNGAPAYLGLNGSCFEKANGGRFIGFVDPTYPQYYGKTQYLAKTSTYSGVIYSTSLSDVQALLLLLNVASSTTSWGVFNLLPAWAPTGTGFAGNNVNLLSQVNVEEFGSLYKINYEVRYAKAGWERDVYVNI